MKVLLVAMLFTLLVASWKTPEVVRVAAPANADSAWDAGAACSGVAAKPDFPLSRVKWFTEKGLQKRRSAIAQFASPDSITFDPDFWGVGWVVEHELLHYRLQREPCDTTLNCDDHPYDPFWFPCMVMYFQHNAGGVMGGAIKK